MDLYHNVYLLDQSDELMDGVIQWQINDSHHETYLANQMNACFRRKCDCCPTGPEYTAILPHQHLSQIARFKLSPRISGS